MIYKKFNTLKSFYAAEGRNTQIFLRKDFHGVDTVTEIEDRKYSWKTGIEKLNIQQPITNAEYKKIYAYDDGDTMDIERYNNNPEMPFMIKRIKNNSGNITGQFAEINCNITEGYTINADLMLNKTRATVAIVDDLENKGIQCKVTICFASADTLQRSHEKILIRIVVKNFDQSLNIGLLTATLAPWFLRYHIFNYLKNNFKCNKNLGKALQLSEVEKELKKQEKNELNNDYIILIDQGECLTKSKIEHKINQINRTLNHE